MTASVQYLRDRDRRSDDIHTSALVFIARHQAEHLAPDRRLLVDRTVAHLQQAFDVSIDTAELTTAQALAEFESRGRREYVDLGATTSFAIFVRDPDSGRTRVFTVAQLMRLVRTPELAAMPLPSARTASAAGILPAQ